MSVNFNHPFGKVKPPSVNYRIIVAALLSLAALPLLLLSSCSTEDANQHVTLTTKQHTTSSQPQVFTPALSQNSTSTQQNQSSTYPTTYYTMNTVEYYSKNHYFANDRIKLSRKVASFIKNPPLRSNPKLHNRYHKVRADFYKIRKYRKKLEHMEDKHVGRNHLLTNVEAKRKRYFELEAELFYQLEKMVYFAEQSYLEWQIFKSHDAIQLSRFERNSVNRSAQTANLFEDFSYAVTNYTNASR